MLVEKQSLLDFDQLMAPISADNPCGIENVDVESLIGQFKIKESQWLEKGHRDVDAKMQAGIDEILNDFQTVFIEKCKSIEIPIYSSALMLQKYGLFGLREVLEWIYRLHSTFPEQFFPSSRAKRVKIINQSMTLRLGDEGSWTPLARQLLLLPVTEAPGEVPLRFVRLRNYRQKPGQQDGADFPPEYASQAHQTPPQFFFELCEHARAAITQAEELNKLVRQAYSEEFPEFTRIVSTDFMDLLREFETTIDQLASQHCPSYPEFCRAQQGGNEEPDSETGADMTNPNPLASEHSAGNQATVQAISGEITSRGQAIDLLQRVADYFKRTERHSPVGYRLQEAIDWTKLDLPDLLAKLLESDRDQLQQLASKIGFKMHDSN